MLKMAIVHVYNFRLPFEILLLNSTEITTVQTEILEIRHWYSAGKIFKDKRRLCFDLLV